MDERAAYIRAARRPARGGRMGLELGSVDKRFDPMDVDHSHLVLLLHLGLPYAPCAGQSRKQGT